MAAPVHPVILSGGAGTRLWPMSRALRPKQLLALNSDLSLLQETVRRVTGPEFAPPLIICNDEHRFMIAEQMRELGVEPEAIVLEPAGRNTAPAAAAAALILADRYTDPTMLMLPSDHVIDDWAAFHGAAETGARAAADGALATFGIPPTRPETGYGYICRGGPYPGIEGCYAIDRFVEKPDRETAQSYLASGTYDWNSGMFVFPVAVCIGELGRLAPELMAGCRAAVAEAKTDLDFLRLARDPFAAIKSISIDYALMEHTDKGAVVPAEMGWSDVGSWSALWDIGARDGAGNVVLGDVMTLDTRECYIRGEGNLIAAIGVENLVIVATDDVILVVPKDRAQEVKAIVEEIEKAGRTEHYVHTKVFRPWGTYQNVDAGPRFLVKEIVVNPGARLSMQMHYHRAEHWIAVSGTAKVTRDNETFYLTEDQSTYIPHNVRHGLENPGKVPLRMIARSNPTGTWAKTTLSALTTPTAACQNRRPRTDPAAFLRRRVYAGSAGTVSCIERRSLTIRNHSARLGRVRRQSRSPRRKSR